MHPQNCKSLIQHLKCSHYSKLPSIQIIKINAQHNALRKALHKIKIQIENIYYVTFRLNLRHLQTSG